MVTCQDDPKRRGGQAHPLCRHHGVLELFEPLDEPDLAMDKTGDSSVRM